LEQYLEKEYSTLVEIVAEVRREIKTQQISLKEDAWHKALDLRTLIKLIQDGQPETAKSLLRDNLLRGSEIERKPCDLK